MRENTVRELQIGLQHAARKALIKARRIKEMVGKRQQARLAASPTTPARAKRTLGKKSLEAAMKSVIDRARNSLLPATTVVTGVKKRPLGLATTRRLMEQRRLSNVML
jgi:hypothetical protein